MRDHLLVLFFLGIIMIIIGFQRARGSPTPKIIYKYVDKTIEEAQKGGQESVYSQFIQMFEDPPLLI